MSRLSKVPGRLLWPAVVLPPLLRLCHHGVLWADEDYHLAAGLQVLYGKVPYRDFWYDKPPLNALGYALMGAQGGWALRIAGAAFVLACCWVAFRLGRLWWGEREGWIAAAMVSFYLTFYLPSTVLPVVPDLALLLPHLGAVYLAASRKPFAAGVAAGVGFLVNAKGVFVLAACALWCGEALPWLALGFVLPNALAAGWMMSTGAWNGYVEQVWRWGWMYAGGTPLAHPVWAGVQRTANWLGWHGALVVGAGWCWRKGLDTNVETAGWRAHATWAVLGLAGAAVGMRFLPRYYFLLLPAMVMAGAKGIALLPDWKWKAAVAVLLLIPLVRFGPRYVQMARGAAWSDLGMDQDSREAAGIVRALGGRNLFVWGYRPGLYVYTRLPAGCFFWDSQPLTGVPADRHLTDSRPLVPEWAAANRAQLRQCRPDVVVDGLGPYNPALRIEAYPDMREWLSGYRLAGRTGGSFIYRIR